eukprot:424287-Prymnesium_polylepis.1
MAAPEAGSGGSDGAAPVVGARAYHGTGSVADRSSCRSGMIRAIARASARFASASCSEFFCAASTSAKKLTWPPLTKLDRADET